MAKKAYLANEQETSGIQKSLNTISHEKKLAVTAEKADSVPGAGNGQDEPGTSCFITK